MLENVARSEPVLEEINGPSLLKHGGENNNAVFYQAPPLV